MRQFLFVIAVLMCPQVLLAQSNLTYGMYGTPGIIDMPTASQAPDGELGVSFSHNAESLRATLVFQITPRLSGAFRYSKIDDFFMPGDALFDRSFDLKYQLFDEGTYRPAVSIGLRDFIGTGTYSGEYVVATKTIGTVQATAGIGWGRLGSHNGFSNPLGVISSSFDARATGFTGVGGVPETDKWFRGPAALFGGVAWSVNDKTTLKLEYSSDAQTTEVSKGHFVRRSPLNVGVDYQLNDRTQLSAYYLHGSEIGLMASFAFDPKSSTGSATNEGAPLPVGLRAVENLDDLGWSAAAVPTAAAMTKALAPVLAPDGITIEGMELSARVATVRIDNTRYGAQAQAVGRVARVLSNVLPASINHFEIVPMVRGVPGSKVVISRRALEQLEHAPGSSDRMLAVTSIQDAGDVNRRAGLPEDRKAFSWSIGPYSQVSLFDPTNPLRVDVGVEAFAEWNPTPGFYVSGKLRQRLLGNLNESTRFSNSVLPHVRSDGNFYNKADGPVLDHLTASYLFRPSTNTYGRVTAGYLERMYGGVSAEVLWKPVGSRFALGAEVNWAKQRSFEGLGFQPLTITAAVNHGSGTDTIGSARDYSAVTGHVSAYYEMNNGFHAQLDVGRYLAGDWGATFSLDREFKNGWRVGAYATFTDVPFSTFGEGSFDKGIRLTIPLSWQLGTPSRDVSETLIQPISRDGGARLQVNDRLYELVRDTHRPGLEARWGRFWR